MLIPAEGLKWLEFPPTYQGTRQKPTLNRTPFLPQAHSHLHSLRLRHLGHTNSPQVHVFGMREETRRPRENPHRHGESGSTPQTVAPAGDQVFLHIIIKQCWAKWRYSRTCIYAVVSILYKCSVLIIRSGDHLC